MPRVECAATVLPTILLGTSVTAHAHLAQTSIQATGCTEIGWLAACIDASENDGRAERKWYEELD